GDRVFDYSHFGSYPMAFCGYAGYDRAIIPAVDDAFLAKLDAVVADVRAGAPRRLIERKRDGETTLLETNPINVLFYPAGAEIGVVGLRYNEGWRDEVLKFGHKNRDRRYLRRCCLIQRPAAKWLSERDAKRRPALKATLPDIELKPVPRTKTPIAVTEAVQAVVLGTLTPNDLFKQSDEYDYLRQYTITPSGIRQLVYEGERWYVVDWQEKNGVWSPVDTE
ncbi:MAG: hypothetical protein AAF790_15360, partial [Planctomycetota bacterium]